MRVGAGCERWRIFISDIYSRPRERERETKICLSIARLMYPWVIYDFFPPLPMTCLIPNIINNLLPPPLTAADFSLFVFTFLWNWANLRKKIQLPSTYLLPRIRKKKKNFHRGYVSINPYIFARKNQWRNTTENSRKKFNSPTPRVRAKTHRYFPPPHPSPEKHRKKLDRARVSYLARQPHRIVINYTSRENSVFSQSASYLSTSFKTGRLYFNNSKRTTRIYRRIKVKIQGELMSRDGGGGRFCLRYLFSCSFLIISWDYRPLSFFIVWSNEIVENNVREGFFEGRFGTLFLTLLLELETFRKKINLFTLRK